MQEHKEKYLTIAECGRLGNLSRATINRLIKSGKLKSVKIGTAVRIPQSAWEYLMCPNN